MIPGDDHHLHQRTPCGVCPPPLDTALDVRLTDPE